MNDSPDRKDRNPEQPVSPPPFDGKTAARKLPTGPGVYLFRDAVGTVLYVGKAADLRKRVSSYFDARPKGTRIMRMVSRIQDIDYGPDPQ